MDTCISSKSWTITFFEDFGLEVTLGSHLPPIPFFPLFSFPFIFFELSFIWSSRWPHKLVILLSQSSKCITNVYLQVCLCGVTFFQVWMWGLSNQGLLGERRTRQLSQPREDIFTGGKMAGRKSRFSDWFSCLNNFAIVLSLASVWFIFGSNYKAWVQSQWNEMSFGKPRIF